MRRVRHAVWWRSSAVLASHARNPPLHHAPNSCPKARAPTSNSAQRPNRLPLRAINLIRQRTNPARASRQPYPANAARTHPIIPRTVAIPNPILPMNDRTQDNTALQPPTKAEQRANKFAFHVVRARVLTPRAHAHTVTNQRTRYSTQPPSS